MLVQWDLQGLIQEPSVFSQRDKLGLSLGLRGLKYSFGLAKSLAGDESSVFELSYFQNIKEEVRVPIRFAILKCQNRILW